MTKITLYVEPEWAPKAVSVANRFLLEWLDESGPRPKPSDCIIVTAGLHMSTTFAVWGTKEHVRVRQEQEVAA